MILDYLNHSGKPLSADDLRILNIILIEYLDRMKQVGLYFETSVADKLAIDQPAITKKRVVECLQQIEQHDLAEILSKKQGEIS